MQHKRDCFLFLKGFRETTKELGIESTCKLILDLAVKNLEICLGKVFDEKELKIIPIHPCGYEYIVELELTDDEYDKVSKGFIGHDGVLMLL